MNEAGTNIKAVRVMILVLKASSAVLCDTDKISLLLWLAEPAAASSPELFPRLTELLRRLIVS